MGLGVDGSSGPATTTTTTTSIVVRRESESHPRLSIPLLKLSETVSTPSPRNISPRLSFSGSPRGSTPRSYDSPPDTPESPSAYKKGFFQSIFKQNFRFQVAKRFANLFASSIANLKEYDLSIEEVKDFYEVLKEDEMKQTFNRSDIDFCNLMPGDLTSWCKEKSRIIYGRMLDPNNPLIKRISRRFDLMEENIENYEKLHPVTGDAADWLKGFKSLLNGFKTDLKGALSVYKRNIYSNDTNRLKELLFHGDGNYIECLEEWFNKTKKIEVIRSEVLSFALLEIRFREISARPPFIWQEPASEGKTIDEISNEDALTTGLMKTNIFVYSQVTLGSEGGDALTIPFEGKNDLIRKEVCTVLMARICMAGWDREADGEKITGDATLVHGGQNCEHFKYFRAWSINSYQKGDGLFRHLYPDLFATPYYSQALSSSKTDFKNTLEMIVANKDAFQVTQKRRYRIFYKTDPTGSCIDCPELGEFTLKWTLKWDKNFKSSEHTGWIGFLELPEIKFGYQTFVKEHKAKILDIFKSKNPPETSPHVLLQFKPAEIEVFRSRSMSTTMSNHSLSGLE